MAEIEAARGWAALAVVLAYAALCGCIAWRVRRRVREDDRDRAALAADGSGPQVLVAYASQTGSVNAWAHQTAHWLHEAGWRARLVSLQSLAPQQLADVERALFLVSTSGEGDPPDEALAFAQACADAATPRLPRLHYGLLAAGDREYPAFCAFGRRLDEWLRGRGARAWFERIEVDGGDAAALADWQRALRALTGIEDAGDTAVGSTQPLLPWRLVDRRCLNAGSPGEPVHLLRLVAVTGDLPPWQSGDLVDLRPPGDDPPLRTYSICNLSAPGGALELLVRRHRGADGRTGLASGWLCDTLPVGETVPLRCRPHPGFRLGDNADRPLVLIGNGTGIAGLRSHLQAVAARGGSAPAHSAWLLFGERDPDTDRFFDDEVRAWQREGWLSHVDLAFSRDPTDPAYVQHRLAAQADRLRDWITQGAAVYVCGSEQGMAQAVEDTLQAVLGADRVAGLRTEGRYRRDVY